MYRKLLTTSLALGLMGSGFSSSANVVINSGQFDWTVFYNPAGQDYSGSGNTDEAWFFTARAKGTTVGNQNGTPLNTTDGDFSWSGTGGSSADYTFSSLTVEVNDPQIRTRGGIDYFITPASGTSYVLNDNPSEVDVGIRTRLADSGFEDVLFTFDAAGSTFNGNPFNTSLAEILIFRDAPFGAVLVETADSKTSWEDVISEHTHYNFGFSEQGDYSLRFTVQGRDALLNPVGAAGSGTIDFSVVPEPQAFALLFGLAALGFAVSRRMGK